MVNLNAEKLDNVFMLNFLKELYFFSDRLKGTGIFFLDGDLVREEGEVRRMKGGEKRA